MSIKKDLGICLNCNINFSKVRSNIRVSNYTGVVKIYNYIDKTQIFCSRKCYELFYKGKKQTGVKLLKSREAIAKAIDARKNNPDVRKKWIDKMKEVTLKEKNPAWIKDRNLLVEQGTRRSYEYLEWRRKVLNRDKHKCRLNNSKCKGKLECHHILPWRKHKELHYQVNNGITLCHAHHPRSESEEKRLEPLFLELVPVSKDKF